MNQDAITAIVQRAYANRAKIENAKVEIAAAEAILDDEVKHRASLSAESRHALSKAARERVERAHTAAEEFMEELAAINRELAALLEAVPDATTAVS